MDSEALQRVRNWLEGGGSSWGVPMQDMQMMTDTIEAQANEIQWLNTLIEDKAAKQIEADGNRIEALQTDNAKLQADNAKLRTALLPFARHIGKVDALVILKIGADTWTGTLTGQDFANAYHEVNLADPKYREWLALQETGQ